MVLGAVAGGVLVGLYRLQPAWLWGLLAGAAGGLLGGAAAAIMGWKRPLAVRLLAAGALLLAGFFLLWLVAGRQWVTDPRNWTVSPP